VLPINNLAKQKLLELEDPLVRLEILEKFLDQRNLLG
jgi:Lon protease-like protein